MGQGPISCPCKVAGQTQGGTVWRLSEASPVEAREDMTLSEICTPVSVVLFLSITFVNSLRLMLIHSSGLGNIGGTIIPQYKPALTFFISLKYVLK